MRNKKSVVGLAVILASAGSSQRPPQRPFGRSRRLGS
jgi:hypothetical protein